MAKEEKKQEVERLKKEIEKYSVIGILDMLKLPSRQLQEIRKKLRGKASIKVMKKSILKLAIKNVSKQGVAELENLIPKVPALIFSNEDGFKLYGITDSMKSRTFAKEGDIAPNDIKVTAGPTDLMPGPAISELTKVGIPAGVEGGKIAVKKDKVVAKTGEVISKNLANALRKLKIEPMEVGLNIVAIYDKGMVYKKDSLSLVGEGYINKLKQAFVQALNLSVFVCWPTKENIKILLAKAFNSARAIESKIGAAPEKEKREEKGKKDEAKPEADAAEKKDEKEGKG